jgi:hypothetical protein
MISSTDKIQDSRVFFNYLLVCQFISSQLMIVLVFFVMLSVTKDEGLDQWVNLLDIH